MDSGMFDHEAVWHWGTAEETRGYLAALLRAARGLRERLDTSVEKSWDVGPVLALYRMAMVLQLKFVVSEGTRFQKAPTDHITLMQTDAVRWLGKLLGQILKNLKWQERFRHKSVEGVKGMQELLEEFEEMEVMQAIRFGRRQRRGPGDVPAVLRVERVMEVTRRLDELVELLERTEAEMAEVEMVVRVSHRKGK
jgi:hypothetical protein